MPECFYRASTGLYTYGFPLKARGNDNQNAHFQSVDEIIKGNSDQRINGQQNLTKFIAKSLVL